MPKFNKPIFIIGCTNSGTKCLFRTLLEHHQLGGPTVELHFFGVQPNIDGRINRLFALYPCFNTNYYDPYNSTPKSYAGPTRKKQVKELMELMPQVTGKNHFVKGDRWLIKDPKLSLRIKWIKYLFPDAKIITMVRNPWAACEGIKRKLHLMGDVPLNLDIPTAAAQWNTTNHIIEMDSKDYNVLRIRYEDLILSKKFPDKTPNLWDSILEYCELDKDFKVPNNSKYSNFEQSRNNYSLNNLSLWETKYINTACADLINKFNYEITPQPEHVSTTPTTFDIKIKHKRKLCDM